MWSVVNHFFIYTQTARISFWLTVVLCYQWRIRNGFSTDLGYPGQVLSDQDGIYLAYLDVWHRHLTALEAPELRDAALGNQDTAARVKNVWQVKLLPRVSPLITP